MRIMLLASTGRSTKAIGRCPRQGGYVAFVPSQTGCCGQYPNPTEEVYDGCYCQEDRGLAN